MTTEILINSRPYEVRIALVEEGHLTEFHIERPTEKGLMGNIYLGKVVRVLPGMQAAFVDIGLDRTGFLYVDDIFVGEHKAAVEAEESLFGSRRDLLDPSLPEYGKKGAHGKNIEDLLVEGQPIVVQVSKDPIGTKGARLTCHITIPCRNLVYIPLTDHIGISRKIEEEDVRARLKEKIENLRPAGAGFIVRTVAEFAEPAELEADMEYLLHVWEDIQDSVKNAAVPSMLYEDLDITLKSIRDLFTNDVDELTIDDVDAYTKLLDFVDTFAPQLKDKITLYESDDRLFESRGLDAEISRAIEKKVWLRSGGYIIIESTEALSVIDVNTGRFVGKNNLNETILKTNLEAAKEIAFQLRLRNIGGIIIIDFIDMEDEEHRNKLFDTFKDAVKNDKSRINILKLSEFGLIQMTRKRNSENLYQLMCEPCHYCAGEGMLKSRRTICYDIFRKISRNARRAVGKTVTVRVHPRIADMLTKEEQKTKSLTEKDTGKRIVVASAEELHLEKYEIIWQH